MSINKRVIIIDDHSLFRDTMLELTERLPGFDVVGTASDAQEGKGIAVDQKPDVAIVDLSLPDKSGIQLSRTLMTLLPELRIVIVSMHSKVGYIISAFRAGAVGYLGKDSVFHSLQPCLEAILNNKFYLDSALSQEVVSKLLDISPEEEHTDSIYGTLSPREQEILPLLAHGLSTKDIADKLFISAKTVANHRANIFGKLGLHSTIELVRYAAQLGLLKDII